MKIIMYVKMFDVSIRLVVHVINCLVCMYSYSTSGTHA